MVHSFANTLKRGLTTDNNVVRLGIVPDWLDMSDAAIGLVQEGVHRSNGRGNPLAFCVRFGQRVRFLAVS